MNSAVKINGTHLGVMSRRFNLDRPCSQGDVILFGISAMEPVIHQCDVIGVVNICSQ